MPQQIELAFKFHQEGRLAEAERLYRELLQARPQDFEALHMLGILKLQQRQAEEAVRLIGEALAVDPRSVAAHSNYGLALSALQRHAEALASYDNALAISPRNADALCNRADALCDLGRPADALESYDLAIAVNPRHIAALVNRGLVLYALGRLADALASYDKALAVDPNDIEAWNNRGVTLQELNRHGEALTSYERALALAPDYADALVNRGNALLVLKRPAEATASYARALVLLPNHVDAHNYRADALSDLGRLEEALASYDRAIAIKPGNLYAAQRRARVLGKLDRYDQAIAAYAELRAIKPDPPDLLNDVVHCHAASCHWQEMPRWAEEITAGAAAVAPSLLLNFDSTPEQQLACARNWLQLRKLTREVPDWKPADFSSDRIRVAYLSADFRDHEIAYLLAELFELHDRKRFEIIGVSFGPDDGSAVRSRLIKSFDRFFDVTTRADEDVVKLLRDLKVHIAVDLNGHAPDARMGILAPRIAPLQANYLGYPGTTGADFIDYVIGDAIVLPLDLQPAFSETIVHLPSSYQVNSTRPISSTIPTRSGAGLPVDAIVFCCFNNSMKINSGMFDVWMRLLSAVEGSVLWLARTNTQAMENLRREADARGVDPSRLVFAPPVDRSQHLTRLALADLCLETLPYNGQTTAGDALWAGVPVLTSLGPTFAGRMTASLLQAVGLPELVTDSLVQYEELALKLAADPSSLRSIRRKLAENRSSHPLFDIDGFRRHIEAAYSMMWETWQRGEAPRSISVSPT